MAWLIWFRWVAAWPSRSVGLVRLVHLFFLARWLGCSVAWMREVELVLFHDVGSLCRVASVALSLDNHLDMLKP